MSDGSRPRPLSSAEVRCAAEEAHEACAGGIIRKVRTPEGCDPDQPGRVVLEVRNAGTNHLLLACADEPVPRLHLVPEAPPSRPEPGALDRLVRPHLDGAVVRRIEAIPGERIALLEAEGRDPETGETRLRRLVIEMIPGHVAAILTAGPDDRILGMRGRPLDPSGVRGLEPGGEWAQPPPAPVTPKAERDRWEGEPDRGAAMHRDLATAERDAALAEERDRVARRLRDLLDRTRRTLETLDQEAERTADADRWRARGELLKSVLHDVRQGATTVTATDWTTDPPEEVEIPLDPDLSPSENLERLFHRYKRLDRGREAVAERRETVRAEHDRLVALQERLAAAEDREGVQQVDAEVGRTAPARRRKAREGGGHRRFVSADGREILVGRNARDNDRLTVRTARPHDLWLHVRGAHGSHVIVRLDRGRQPSTDTLVDAATLAVHFSELRGARKAEVDWVERRHVRKPKGAATGAVHVDHPRTILVEMEPERLERLLQGRDTGGDTLATS